MGLDSLGDDAALPMTTKYPGRDGAQYIGSPGASVDSLSNNALEGQDMANKRRWCAPCLLFVGIALYVYAATVLAMDPLPLPGPDYSVWFQLLLGLVVALIGAYAKGLSGRVSENAKAIADLAARFSQHQVSVATNHHTKTENNEQYGRVERSLLDLHRRLDHLHVPSTFPHS